MVGREVTGGIRPQHTSVGENQLTATIEVSETMGSEVHPHAHSDA